MSKVYKTVVSLLVLGAMLAAPLCAGNAEHEPWDCPQCDRIGNTGNYCGGCGHPAPGPDTLWTGDPTQVGSYVTFGHYPHTASGTDNTPIEWLVLEVQGNKALLISKYGLDRKSYNAEAMSVTWETCTLRTWLNKPFLNKAFSAGEQEAILTTAVDNSNSQGYSEWHTIGGNITQDKIFLLSYAEANKYFDVSFGNTENTKSRVESTVYAIKPGATIDNYHQTADGRPTGWWWLRSPGDRQKYAAYVDHDGSLNSNDVRYGGGCVRPALWINLESDTLSTAAPTAAPGPDDTTALRTGDPTQVGSYVTFGHYPQTADGTDSTPIEWLVLEYDSANNCALLISKYGLDAKPFNEKAVEITWEKCTLRTWLNRDFLNKAFSAGEQEAILTTVVDNSSSQGYSKWSTSGGNDTQDMVFLLSYAEANKYFVVAWEDSHNAISRVVPTGYAIKQGAITSRDNRTAESKAVGWWWLRSPGHYQGNAAGVLADGSLYVINVSDASGCIRPALWINLNADIF